MKKKILVFCDFYLPGTQSGGGMWTIVNLVDRFREKYDFFIVTRNYDSRFDRKPFETVRTDAWNEVRGAQVYYFGEGKLTVERTRALVEQIRPDMVLLNSALSQPVRRFLSTRRKGVIPDIPVILAPCGEFAPGALSIKPFRKRLFLRYAVATGLYRDVLWKASSDSEAREIAAVIGSGSDITIVPDLAPRTLLPDYSQSSKPVKEKGSVRFILMSRIVPKKNLHYFLECLQEIGEGDITFEIVGPVEDQTYWKRCKDLLDTLPGNISVEVVGPLDQNAAIDRVFNSHFFVLPTLNENFGYVFIESLAAGSPLLISDRTIWNDIEEHGVGWAIPLEDRALFLRRIRECIDMSGGEYAAMSRAAREYAVNWLAGQTSDSAFEELLERALVGL